MVVCCQNLTLGALSNRGALSALVGALFKKFGLFLNTPRIYFIALCYTFRPFLVKNSINKEKLFYLLLLL
jgi:hypothetical protein